MSQKIRILIVDDSAFMRKSLSIILDSDPNIEIIGTAKNGLEGVEKAKSLKPDIITLDIEMPVMDGITALQKIMKEAPTSVVMVSSLTTEGAESTLKALDLGAVDFISKEMSFVSIDIVHIKDELIKKIKTIARQKNIHKRLSTINGSSSTKVDTKTSKGSLNLPKMDYSAISIGISTGGPLSLQKIIPLLDSRINVPIFIVQHMPPNFTKSLAKRLNSTSGLNVKEAEDGESVQKGTIYIAPGGKHMTVTNGTAHKSTIRISDYPEKTLYKPCVDIMMNSVNKVFGKSVLGVIMTGMGKDGLKGLRELKELGGKCLAQNESSCVVYGMPKAVVDAGLADVVAPLIKIPEIINKALL